MLRVQKRLESTRSSKTQNVDERGWRRGKAIVSSSLLPLFFLLGLYFLFFLVLFAFTFFSLRSIYNCPLLLFHSQFPSLPYAAFLAYIFFSFGLPCFTSGFPDGLFCLFPELPSSPISYSSPPTTALFLQLQFFPLKTSLGHTGFVAAHLFKQCWQGGGHSRQAGPRRQKRTWVPEESPPAPVSFEEEFPSGEGLPL